MSALSNRDSAPEGTPRFLAETSTWHKNSSKVMRSRQRERHQVVPPCNNFGSCESADIWNAKQIPESLQCYTRAVENGCIALCDEDPNKLTEEITDSSAGAESLTLEETMPGVSLSSQPHKVSSNQQGAIQTSSRNPCQVERKNLLRINTTCVSNKDGCSGPETRTVATRTDTDHESLRLSECKFDETPKVLHCATFLPKQTSPINANFPGPLKLQSPRGITCKVVAETAQTLDHATAPNKVTTNTLLFATMKQSSSPNRISQSLQSAAPSGSLRVIPSSPMKVKQSGITRVSSNQNTATNSQYYSESNIQYNNQHAASNSQLNNQHDNQHSATTNHKPTVSINQLNQDTQKSKLVVRTTERKTKLAGWLAQTRSIRSSLRSFSLTMPSSPIGIAVQSPWSSRRQKRQELRSQGTRSTNGESVDDIGVGVSPRGAADRALSRRTRRRKSESALPRELVESMADEFADFVAHVSNKE